MSAPTPRFKTSNEVDDERATQSARCVRRIDWAGAVTAWRYPCLATLIAPPAQVAASAADYRVDAWGHSDSRTDIE
jgi:hypothetical protein